MMDRCTLGLFDDSKCVLLKRFSLRDRDREEVYLSSIVFARKRSNVILSGFSWSEYISWLLESEYVIFV